MTETIEQRAERLYPVHLNDPNILCILAKRHAYIAGATDELERVKGLVEALKEIEAVCDNTNPTHERMWRVAYEALNQFKNEGHG